MDERAAPPDELGSASAGLVILPADPRSPSVRVLVEALDRYQQGLYPPESNHLLDIESLAAPDVLFWGAWRGGSPAAPHPDAGVPAGRAAEEDAGETALGCAALRLDPRGYGEIKRMFVLPAGRGRGVARALMVTIEEAARERGLGVLRLETGTRQPEAIALYERCGFSRRGPFGDYPDDPLSVFMERQLG